MPNVEIGRLIQSVALVGAVVLGVAASPALGSSGSVDLMQPLSAQPGFDSPCTELPFAANEPESEFQPEISVDPTDANRLTVVWTQGLFLGAVLGISDDGGHTWTQHEAPVSRCQGGDGGFSADPWITYGPDGTLYLISITGDEVLTSVATMDQSSKLVVLRSSDGGRSWSPPSTVVDDSQKNDRPALTVDPSNPRRLFATWTKSLPNGGFAMYESRSSDGARSWSTPRNLYETGPDRWPAEPSLRVLGDGTVLNAFEELASDGTAREMALRSTDGGRSWSSVQIAESHGSWPTDPDLNMGSVGHPEMSFQVIGNAAPTIEVGPDGSVVASWQDMSTADAASINFARSTDGGATWNQPTVIRSGAGQAWCPTIAVDRRGRIGISWYDTRADRPGDGAWTGEVWSAQSRDNGTSWTQARLSGPFNLRTSLISPPNAITLGNYFGLAPIPGGFGAVFTLPHPQAVEPAQDIFFTRLRTGRRTARGRLGERHRARVTKRATAAR